MNCNSKRFSILILAAMLLASVISHQSWAKIKKTTAYPLTYRNYSEPYNKVWNAAVRLLFDDLKFAPLAADSEQGFMSTRWKTTKGKERARDRRVQVNLNIKKAAAGTLVTVGCEIEEFVPIKGTDEGRWMDIPSDHSCEAQILDQLEAKLRTK